VFGLKSKQKSKPPSMCGSQCPMRISLPPPFNKKPEALVFYTKKISSGGRKT